MTTAVTETENAPEKKSMPVGTEKGSERNNESDLAGAAQIRYMTPANTKFDITEGRMLNVTIDGVQTDSVYVHCSFPHTNKRIYLSIRTFENKEIGMIRSLDEFPPDVAVLLEEQVRVRYFAPEITRVIKIKDEFGYSYWETETTSGICRFTVRSGGSNAKLVGENRLLVTDVDGNRFVIPDLEKLSDKEYRMVEMCM
ncbi:DUF1854 domain-containing protein [Paenibacillus allorhizosphaerae]|uniref:DUF1854 domain-containing protein n=1 Tax=Paenibacillus allorhizosphaerae TaxID=2849866 RepID=A0ABM8VHT8_9BACL|nr:DUF1854 domain-containing protein [Paenibacillus allorhizosphaerae]CAG7643000.1 hypothetical protein PAECIP111802_02935 [Paenibacillus allorhizosphaerae]